MNFKNNLTRAVGRPRIRIVEPTAIGNLIGDRRRQKGWSLYQLSALCGQAPQTIHAIERGVSRHPHPKTLLPILDALGIDPGEAGSLLLTAV